MTSQKPPSLPPMLILCGGLGSRLRAVVSDRPKPMAEVEGRPFLEHLLDYHRAQGISRFLLCAGHFGEMIDAHFRNIPDVEVIVEGRPLGTAGSVALAARHLEAGAGAAGIAHYFVSNGDSFCAVDLARLYRLTIERNALATLAVSRVANNGDYGTLSFRADGILTHFLEKPPISEPFCQVNAGVYCFSRALTSELPEQGSLERDVFPRLVETGRVGVMPIESAVLDIGTPDRLAGAAEELRRIRSIQREHP